LGANRFYTYPIDYLYPPHFFKKQLFSTHTLPIWGGCGFEWTMDKNNRPTFTKVCFQYCLCLIYPCTIRHMDSS
jgi:hypothetical protein